MTKRKRKRMAVNCLTRFLFLYTVKSEEIEF